MSKSKKSKTEVISLKKEDNNLENLQNKADEVDNLDSLLDGKVTKKIPENENVSVVPDAESFQMPELPKIIQSDERTKLISKINKYKEQFKHKVGHIDTKGLKELTDEELNDKLHEIHLAVSGNISKGLIAAGIGQLLPLYEINMVKRGFNVQGVTNRLVNDNDFVDIVKEIEIESNLAFNYYIRPELRLVKAVAMGSVMQIAENKGMIPKKVDKPVDKETEEKFAEI